MKLENRPNAQSPDVLSDDALLQRLGELARRQHALTAALLAHIAEVDRRRLYLREACPSMHRYCVERLGLSDGAAYKRIRAARAARRFPLILEMVERGELHLKGVTLLSPHLRETSHREVLARAKGQSVRATEKLVAELCPRPDVPSRVRAIPARPSARPQAPAPAIAVEPPAVEPASARKQPVLPLAPRRYELRITIDEAAHADLEQLRDLLAHLVPDRDPAIIVARALELLLERTLARKAAITARRDDRARAPVATTRTRAARGRGISPPRFGARCGRATAADARFATPPNAGAPARARSSFTTSITGRAAPTTIPLASSFAVALITSIRPCSTTVRRISSSPARPRGPGIPAPASPSPPTDSARRELAVNLCRRAGAPAAPATVPGDSCRGKLSPTG